MKEIDKERKLKEALKFIVSLLRKKKIPFQIAGGFAASVYGSKRPIKDIDIDIPDSSIDTLAKEIKKYTTDGPIRYRGYRFDLYLLAINYRGQEIDFSGADSMKNSDVKNKKWVKYPGDLTKVHFKKAYGFLLPIIPPEGLIKYKKLLKGKHHKIDIVAIENYIKNKK